MKHTITFETGETTCAIEPGKFCMWQATTRLGTIPVCRLFDNEPLFHEDGWLQRCQLCKDRFK